MVELAGIIFSSGKDRNKQFKFHTVKLEKIKHLQKGITLPATKLNVMQWSIKHRLINCHMLF